MTQIPPPSPRIISSLLKVIQLCRQGNQKEAAKHLIADTRVIAVNPTMITDVYHLANAAIKLNVERQVINEPHNEQLLLMIKVLKNENIHLIGVTYLNTLYDSMNTQVSSYEKHCTRPIITERYDALHQVDLDHFTPDFLLRMGASLLNQGHREYEKRNLEEALACFRNALRISKHLEFTEGIITCLFEVGYMIHSRGESTFAEQHYRDAIAMSVDITSVEPGTIARYIFHAGRYFELEGNTNKAREYFQEALRMFEESGDTEGFQACLDKLNRK